MDPARFRGGAQRAEEAHPMRTPAKPRTYALLADGSTVEIRHALGADADAVREMHVNLSG